MTRLAPIVDRMQSLAETELPAPRTCEVTLWDDGTFRIVVWHAAEDERQQLRYERTTGEIVWERIRGAETSTETFANGETVFEPTYESFEARVVERVDPPQP